MHPSRLGISWPRKIHKERGTRKLDGNEDQVAGPRSNPSCAAPHQYSGESFSILQAHANRYGTKVKHGFVAFGDIAEEDHGTWRIREMPWELLRTYLQEAGSEAEGTIIRINRLTAELFHSAAGGISVCRTRTEDKPFTRPSHGF